MKTVKQVIGIDVAQDELVVKAGVIREDLSQELIAGKNFKNSLQGFESLTVWTEKVFEKDVAVSYVMEATGVYHESLAYYLDEHGYKVCIVLPNKISNFARTLDTKTVTDKTASEAIALFGLSRKLQNWSRPTGVYRKIRHLTRERTQLIDERTMLKNQFHAEKAQAEPCESSIIRLKARIAMICEQEKEIKAEISALIKSDSDVKHQVDVQCSLPGIAMLTACSVLAETNGFDLIRNKRQITSYAGLDIIEKQSGTSVKGKTRISKKGNKYLRKSLHMSALTALRTDDRFKNIFIRLVSRHGIKMKAVVAVQRKLLEMMYTLHKTQKPYEKDYLHKTRNCIKKNSGQSL